MDTFSSARIVPLDKESNSCAECGDKFIFIVRRKCHCYYCGRALCSNCLTGSWSLPFTSGSASSSPNSSQNGEESNGRSYIRMKQRSVCSPCHKVLQQQELDFDQLHALSVKELHTFLDAFGISSHDCFEKMELVHRVKNTVDCLQKVLTAAENRDDVASDSSQFARGVTTLNFYREKLRLKTKRSSKANESNNANTGNTSTGTAPPRRTQTTPPPPEPPRASGRRTPPHAAGVDWQDQINTFLNPLAQVMQEMQRNMAPLFDELNPQTATPNSVPTQPVNTESSSQSASNRPRTQSVPQQMPSAPPLSDLVAGKVDPASLSTRQLCIVLDRERVNRRMCVEREDLLRRVQLLIADSRAETVSAPVTTAASPTHSSAQEASVPTAPASTSPNTTGAMDSDAQLCKICMDAPANAVLLECGHMMACVPCAKQLKECPICREPIIRVIRAFRA